MIQMLRDATIGRNVRKAANGILTQERFSGATVLAVVDWSTEAGEFEIIVRRKGEDDGG